MAKRRYEIGLSQPDLVAKCQILGWDISRDIVAGIEGGARSVEDWEILVLAHALKIPAAELLPEDADISSLPFPSPEHLAKRRRVIVRVKAQARRRKQ